MFNWLFGNKNISQVTAAELSVQKVKRLCGIPYHSPYFYIDDNDIYEIIIKEGNEVKAAIRLLDALGEKKQKAFIEKLYGKGEIE